jgi:hypothetical protein
MVIHVQYSVRSKLIWISERIVVLVLGRDYANCSLNSTDDIPHPFILLFIFFNTWHTTSPKFIFIAHSWSWALLKKPPIVKLLKNFPEFYGTRRFITVFSRVLHWSLSWARSNQSIPSHPIPQRATLILSTHLCLGLPSGLFPSRFPTNIQNLYSYFPLLISSFCVVCLTMFSISQNLKL